MVQRVEMRLRCGSGCSCFMRSIPLAKGSDASSESVEYYGSAARSRDSRILRDEIPSTEYGVRSPVRGRKGVRGSEVSTLSHCFTPIAERSRKSATAEV